MEINCSPRQSLLMFLLFIFMFVMSLRGDESVDGSNIAQAPTMANNTYNITHDVIDKKDGRGGGGGGGSGGGEFAQCVVKGRCKGMRLDCPLHCGGPCFYDCIHMCKAHCRRRR
ncbi:hypothetical protein A4A49_33845 [Nicotiana attenuata]|uniref:Uncharacterized protein n=1 Tax=Nicotiana attenuata TaxID=49451 RepID=A0A1J6JWV0_NICAT|nr:hypothetical protein A4A49_33845 [Nicotiana attenuata]